MKGYLSKLHIIYKVYSEKSSNNIILYNMIFPLWLLWIIPSTWIVILPANFLIDLAVLLITMHCLKISGRKEIIKRSVWKIWVFGFISDFIGTFYEKKMNAFCKIVYNAECIEKQNEIYYTERKI